MADTFELVALALPSDVAPEALPEAIKRLVADCWPGMSRAQLIARARRHALHPSLRAHGASAPGETGHFLLTLVVGGNAVHLIAHLRRVAARRTSARRARSAKPSRPPERDPRQRTLF
jgi:hypothetical protein